jgi:hypothetical protein
MSTKNNDVPPPPGTALGSSATLQKAEASRSFLEKHYGRLQGRLTGGAGVKVGPRAREPVPDDFELLQVIGRGAFGDVYICRRRAEGARPVDASTPLFAMKRIAFACWLEVRADGALRNRAEKRFHLQ